MRHADRLSLELPAAELARLDDHFPWRYLAPSTAKSRAGFVRYAKLAPQDCRCVISIRDGGQLRGFLLAEEDRFDSAHFGKSCFRLHAVLAQGNDERIKVRLIKSFLRAKPAAQWLYARCDAEDISLLHALLSCGFRLVTTEITFRWDASSLALLSKLARPPAGVVLRSARPPDARVLRAFAPYFSTNRFVRDPAVERQKAVTLYESWIVNALNGRFGEEDEVWVAECAGKIVGFATTCIAGRWSRAYGVRVGTPGLVAVKPRLRRQGLNQALIAKSLLSLLKRADFAVAPSHATNLRMIRSELKTGALPVGVEYICHLHR